MNSFGTTSRFKNSMLSSIAQLFNAGVGSLDSIDTKRIVITNYTIGLALFWCIFYSIVLCSFNLFPLNYIFYFFTFYYTLVWRVNYSGKFLVAKLGLYIGLLIQVFLMSYILDDQLNVKTFYIPITIIPFIVFGQKERKYLYFAIAATILNIVLINSIDHVAEGFQINSQSKDEFHWLFVSLDIACIICMITLAFLFLSVTELGENLLKQKNKELELSRQEQQRLNELKGKLLSIISHDFRSPLNNFQNIVELIAQDQLSKEETTFLIKGLGNSVKNTSHVLDNLLSWSSGQLNNFVPDLKRFLIKEHIEKIVHQLEYKYKAKNLSIIQTLDANHFIIADEGMLEIIVRNLITNAIKFSHAGQNIEISSSLIGTKIIIEITDYGIGIPDEIFQKLFSPDYSKSRYGTAQEKGFGLGLLLCKELVHLHKGDITVTSVRGKTTFSLALSHSKEAETRMVEI